MYNGSKGGIMEQPTKESFLRDVKDHKLTILKNDGLYRHLFFKSPFNSNQYFEIITFPGGLLFTGDMGTYEFERTDDMLDFFRHPRREFGINTVYWAEKVKSESVFGNGIREFDPIRFRENVKERWSEYFESDLQSEEAQIVWIEIEEQILCGEDSDWDLVSKLNNFYMGSQDTNFTFDDFWGDNCKTKTYHFIWCCYAVAWAVIQYDKEKS